MERRPSIHRRDQDGEVAKETVESKVRACGHQTGDFHHYMRARRTLRPAALYNAILPPQRYARVPPGSARGAQPNPSTSRQGILVDGGDPGFVMGGGISPLLLPLDSRRGGRCRIVLALPPGARGYAGR